MASTSEEEQKPKEEEPKAEAQAEEPKTVPLDEHVKLRQKKSEAEKRAAELEAELASLKNPKKAEGESKNDFEDRVRQLETRDRNRALSRDLGVTEDQAEAVASFLEKAPNVQPEEALEILRKREPDKFKSDGPPELSHGQLRPRPGAHPKQSQQGPSWKDRIDYASELRTTNKREANKIANNMAGHLAAKALGWDHKLIPIPSK